MRYIILLTLIIIACSPAIADDQTLSQVAADPPMWEEYKPVVNQNIFVRNRTKPRPANAKEEKAYIVETLPTPHLALRGIAQRGQRYIAFVEDTKTGQVIVSRVGDDMAGGEITNLTLAYLQFAAEEQTYTISVGQMLTTQTQSGAQSDYFGSTTQEVSANDNDSSEKLSIIERLRRKREAQLGKDSKNE